MEASGFLLASGVLLAAFAWFRFRRDDTRFWVFGKPVWYHLTPLGAGLFIAGQCLILGGILACLR